MISTVTISTVSTMTTASMVGSIALIVSLVLLILLVQKELAISFSTSRTQRLSRALNVAIIPLLIAFLMIAIVKVAEVLR